MNYERIMQFTCNGHKSHEEKGKFYRVLYAVIGNVYLYAIVYNYKTSGSSFYCCKLQLKYCKCVIAFS